MITPTTGMTFNYRVGKFMGNINYYNEMHIEDRHENNTVRVPICFCVDTSHSMGTVVEGEQYIKVDGKIGIVEGTRAKKIDKSDIDSRVVTRIDKVKNALNVFYDNLDDDAVKRCQIATVLFNDKPYLWENFTHYHEYSRGVDEIEAVEDTNSNLPAAIEKSLELIDELVNEYDKKRIRKPHRPILVLLTDGETQYETSAIARRVREMQDRKKLYLFPIALEKEAKCLLEQFTLEGEKIININNMQELNNVFERLSKSVSMKAEERIAELDNCKF